MMSSRGRLKSSMPTEDMVLAMVDGNLGALSVCMKLFEQDPFEAFLCLYWLDNVHLYGSDIWIAYKNCCDQDLSKLKDALRDPQNRRLLKAAVEQHR